MNGAVKKPKPTLFTFNLPEEGLSFINELVYTKIVEGYVNYSLTSAFMEGLILLQETYPNVPKRLSLKRRYYKGGAQKNKGKIHKTSIFSSLEINSSRLNSLTSYSTILNVCFLSFMYINIPKDFKNCCKS